jgi:hypothetical protein
VRGDAASIDARAQAIAVQQSVEMPLSAIDDPHVLSDIVGRVESIAKLGDGVFAVRIGRSRGTVECLVSDLCPSASHYRYRLPITSQTSTSLP